MIKVGFIKSDKKNEKRRALLPQDIVNVKNKEYLYFEEGYGEELGISDEEYKKLGCHICTKNEILAEGIDAICDPKIGDANYLTEISDGKIIFGWIHAVQNKDITDKLLAKKTTVYAWEDMFEDERHVFWKNNEMAGEAASMHALICYGALPYDSKVAIIGNGNSSKGAFRVFTQLGARVNVYTRKMENLLKKELGEYDIIINTVLWDVTRKDHIINKDDLKRMKKNSLIIDISCDKKGAIETSIPTTIDNPTYYVDGVMHYVVDHTPSLFYRTISKELSKEVCKYIDYIITSNKCDVLDKAQIIKEGIIIDDRINKFQNRK